LWSGGGVAEAGAAPAISIVAAIAAVAMSEIPALRAASKATSSVGLRLKP
jgi:hypothetical protein